MEKFKLIDDYLTGRLSAEEVKTFEKQLADPAFKADVKLQGQILEGIKKARVAELKAMLNKVPVSESSVNHFSVMKMAAGMILASVIGAVAYFYVKSGEVPMKNASTDLLGKVETITVSKAGKQSVIDSPLVKKQKAYRSK